MTWVGDFSDAIRRHDLAAIKALVAADETRIRYSAAFSPNWLWSASDCSSLEVIKYFLEEAGLDPETRHEHLGNALTMAASAGRADIVRYLLSKNVKIEVARSEWNPLLAALTSASRDVHEVVMSLLEAGIDSRIKYDLAGSKALMGARELATEYGRGEIASIIQANNDRLDANGG